MVISLLRFMSGMAVGLVLWGSPFSLPAVAQNCTHYLNSTDGNDGNDGTRPSQAVRSFEYAFETFPDGATVCMTAGEYFYQEDADGVQLTGPAVQGKQMTFVLQAFAGESRVRFSEDAFVLDVGSGGVTFLPGTSQELIFGKGIINIPANFPGNTGFLHTLALGSGTLDVTRVDVTLEEPVGNPSYGAAPDTAAVVRAAGTLLTGDLTLEAASRTFRYTGTTNRTVGPELPTVLEGSRLVFDHSGGTVTVDRALQFGENGRIELHGAGDAVFAAAPQLHTSGAVQVHAGPGAAGTLAFPAGVAISAAAPGTFIRNEGAGTIDVGTLAVSRAPETGSAAFVSLVENAGPGALLVASITATPNNQGGRVEVALHNVAGGTLAVGTPGASTSLRGALRNTGAGALRLDGDVLLQGPLENRGVLDLGPSTLTLSGGAPYLNADGARIVAGGGRLDLAAGLTLEGGGTLPHVRAVAGASVLEATSIEGDLVVLGSASLALSQATRITGLLQVSGTLTHATPLTVGRDLLLDPGTLDLGADLSIAGDVLLAAGSRLVFDDHTLSVAGNLTRTGGAVLAGAGTLRLDGGGSQTLRAGPNFLVHDLIVAGGGTRVVVSEGSVDVLGDATIATGASIELGNSSLRMSGDGSRFELHGSYTTREGRLIFADPDPAARPQQIAGTGVYGDVEIALSTPDDYVVVAAPVVQLSGTLRFVRGGLDLNGNTLALSDARMIPVLRVETGGIPAGGLVIDTAEPAVGRFDASATRYDLVYEGTLTARRLTGREFASARVRDLTLSYRSQDTAALTLDAGRSIYGSLRVAQPAILDVDAHTLATAGADFSHQVEGRIRGRGNLLLTGTGQVTGSLSPIARSFVERLRVRSQGTVTVKDVNRVSTLQVESGQLRLGLAPTSITGQRANVDVYDQKGGTVVLTAGLVVSSLLRMTGGTLDLGNFDARLPGGAGMETAAGASIVAGGATTGGFVILEDGPGQHIDAGAPLLRLRIDAGATHAATLAGDLTVTGILEHRSGRLDLDGRTLTLSGAQWLYRAGEGYGTSGTVAVTDTTTLVMGVDASVPVLQLAEHDALLRLESDTADTSHALVVTGLLQMQGGTLLLGAQDLRLAGSGPVFAYAGGQIGSSGGALRFQGPAPQSFSAAGGLVIPYLTIENDVTLASDVLFEVRQRFTFGAKGSSLLFATPQGNVVIPAGGTLARAGTGTLSRRPVLTAPELVNVAYQAAVTTGIEIPPSGTLTALTVDVPAGAVQLDRSLRITNVLYLDRGNLQTTPRHTVTMAAGAAIVRSHGTINASGEGTNATGGPYRLVYSNTTPITTASGELPENLPIALLHVAGESTVALHDNRTVDSLLVGGAAPGARFNVNNKTLKVRGGVRVQGGAVSSSTGLSSLVVEGDLRVEPGATVENSPNPPPSGTLSATVRGTTTVRGAFASGELLAYGDVVVETSGDLGDALLLSFLGFQPSLVLPGGDGDPWTVDAAVAQLTVDLSGPIEGESGPQLTLVAPDTAAVTLLARQLHLESGLLVTGPNDIRLPPGEVGFAHTGTVSVPSHVVGYVSRAIVPGRDEPIVDASERRVYPVGSGYPDAAYRPAETYLPASTPGRPVLFRVGHVGTRAGLEAGLPLDGGAGIVIRDTAPFYWLVETDPALPPETPYTLVLTPTGLTTFDPHAVNRLRVLHSAAGSGTALWRLLGIPSVYSNQLVDTPQPRTPAVRLRGASGLPAALHRYTVGVEAAFVDLARLQFVNAAPDPTLPAIDVYRNGVLFIDNLDFRRATSYVPFEPGTYTIAIAPGTSLRLGEAFYQTSVTVTAGEDYAAIAHGLRQPESVPAFRDGRDVSFRLTLAGREAVVRDSTTADAVQLAFFNGIPDAPPLSLVGSTSPQPLFADVAYGALAAPGVLLPPDAYVFSLTGAPEAPPLVMAHVDLRVHPGASVLAVGSGLATVEPGTDGPAEALFFVLGDGTVLSEPATGTPTEPPPLDLPHRLALHGNYPNPFNPSTRIAFDLPAPADVHVDVFDLLGRRVLTTTPQPFGAGRDHTLPLDAGPLGSGLYLYRLTARTGSTTSTASGRMMLVK